MSSAVAEGDDVVAGDDLFAAREFENERLVERRNDGEVERVETLHRRKMRGADAALDHAPFTIDEFKLGEAQEEADLTGNGHNQLPKILQPLPPDSFGNQD